MAAAEEMQQIEKQHDAATDKQLWWRRGNNGAAAINGKQ
jgi:hypothetical protein